MGTFGSATKVLQHDYLLEYILENISDECEEKNCNVSEVRYPPIGTGDPCIHNQMFAQFLRVSTQWFRVAARYCWISATLNQLRILVRASCEDGVRGDFLSSSP